MTDSTQGSKRPVQKDDEKKPHIRRGVDHLKWLCLPLRSKTGPAERRGELLIVT